MDGWISIHRTILDHPVLKARRPFSKFEAWIWILLNVNYTRNEKMVGNQLITVEPGQIITSIKKLGSTFGWSRTKTKLFLNNLQTIKSLEHKTHTKYTTLTVCNWDRYQNEETSKRHQKDIKRTSKRHQKDIKKAQYNKGNKENNGNKGNKGNKKTIDSVKIFAPEIEKAVMSFYEYQSSQFPKDYNGWRENKTLINNSCEEIDKLMRIDGYSLDDIQDTLSFAVQSDFWKGVVKSLSGLRIKSKTNGMKKFVNIRSAMERKEMAETKPMTNVEYSIRSLMEI